MNRKIGITLIFLLGFLAILAIVYYVFSFSKKPTSNQSVVDKQMSVNQSKVKKNSTSTSTKIKKTTQTTAISIKTKAIKQSDIERMAKSFAERFGSFSNQSNYANIRDLKIFMTKKMQIWADAYITKHQKINASAQVYYGITTKALSVKVQDYHEDDNQAVVLVTTRRREAVESTNNSSRLYNQDILITFIKEKQVWKVNSAYWQN